MPGNGAAIEILCPDGTPRTAKVKLNGEILSNCSRIEFILDAKEAVAQVKITIIPSSVIVNGDKLAITMIKEPIKADVT